MASGHLSILVTHVPRLHEPAHCLESSGEGPSTVGSLHILFPLSKCSPSLLVSLIITLSPTYLVSIHISVTSLTTPTPHINLPHLQSQSAIF